MRAFLVLAIMVVVAASPVAATTPEQAVLWEALAGALGSAVGWFGGFLVGRTLATALGFESQPVAKDLVTLSCVVITVTGGATLGVIGAGSWLGIDGNALACVGGALIGMPVGMVVEPLLGQLLSASLPQGSELFQVLGPVVEGIGFACMVVLPAIGATVGFNIGARER